MNTINSLLNHDSHQQPAHPQFIAPTTYDAADALATLATLGSGQQYLARELPEPTAFTPPPRRSSSFSSHAAPVEPEPPIDEPQAHSPTLEQYHHGSKSPEAQRRQSLALARSSPAPVLAPIQNRSTSLQHKMSDPAPALDRDESQAMSPLSQSGERSSRDEMQDREPTHGQDELADSQNRALKSPSPSNELPIVKHEPSGTPQEGFSSTAPAQSVERRQSTTAETMDADTFKAIEIAKQSDLGLRTKRNPSVAESVTSPTEQSRSLPSKKRPAPSGASAIKKKGTATAKKPPSKKRKLDAAEGDNPTRSVTPSSRATKTSASKSGRKGSQAGTPAAESSPAPDHSSQVHPTDDEGDSSEDNSLYCICRKPDNHRWMIGCDGGCDDWFHGSCVNMVQADEDLVDRFICPLCEEKGRGQTTWKPMCRRDGCRKPARTTKGKESKYCSDECGTLFMSEQVQRTAGAKALKKKGAKKKSGKNGEGPTSDDEDEPTPLGGVLRAKDLKALIDQTKDIQAFKNLGSGVLSPPRTASPTKGSFDGADDPALTAGEKERLNALYNEKSQLKDRLEVLKDREKFVSMIKDQVTRIAEREKVKAKELCGYDSRLSWSDAEFLRWRDSKTGQAAFKFMTLSPTTDQIGSLVSPNGEPAATSTPEEQQPESICTKKRCQKHAQWQKQNLQDARFEEVEIAESIRECEKEEKSVRERAARRGAKDKMARELRVGDTNNHDDRNREGWVETLKT